MRSRRAVRPLAALCLLVGVACSTSDDDPPPAAVDVPDAPPTVDAPARLDAGPPDVPAPPVDVPVVADTPDAGPPPPPQVVIVAPPSVPVGVRFPVLIRAAGSHEGTLQAGGEVQAARVHRGLGSVSLIGDQAGGLGLTVDLGGGLTATAEVTVEDRPIRELSGSLEGEALQWGAGQDVRLSADVIVPAGATLSIAAGARVRVGAGVRLHVQGRIEAAGTADAPILIAGDTAAPWSELTLDGAGPHALDHVWLTGGGSDGSRVFGHSSSQPVVRVWQGATLVMRGGGVVDSPGKAFGTQQARVTLQDVLVTRCDTGGEFDESHVTIERSHFVELPDGDGQVEDDDNDGVYLVGVFVEDGVELESVIRDSVFRFGEDDGIDHNDARVLVERVWIEGFHHEGVAASNGRRVTVRDSVVKGCEQGIEAGYGSPEVVVEHCALTGNDVGLRFGDSYDWGAHGKMTVLHTISVENTTHDLWNFLNSTGAPEPGGVVVECSILGGGGVSWDAAGCPAAAAADDPACAGAAPGPRVCP